MKEKKLSEKNIINTLEKNGYIEICPICAECCSDMIYFILSHGFINPTIVINQVSDEIFSLRIMV